MLKFMKHQQKLTPERIQKQKELFAYTKACQHGFPSKPSALAYDSELKLLAIATRSAAITVYGAPGVEFYGQHDSHDHAVTSICFVPGQGMLVTLCDDNSLHQWQVVADGGPSSSQLHLKKSTKLEGKLKRVSVLNCAAASSNLLVGTEGGNVYLCSLTTFAVSDNIIYQDVVMQNVPEAYKVNPGAVEALCQHPAHPGRVLIGYQRGLTVLWDMASLTALQTYVSNQQLEHITWHPDGNKFLACHNDGSITIWPSNLPDYDGDGGNESSSHPEPLDGPNTVYGPFPCKPITRVDWRRARGGGNLLVLGGGMPRASHGDRNTVSVMNYNSEADADSSSTDQHVAFSLSSRVVDFCVTASTVEEEDEKTHDTNSVSVAGCLVVLCEEEVVFLDLRSPEWPTVQSPYLCSLHCSAITCTAFVPAPPPAVYAKIMAAGQASQTGLSTLPFPISGGCAAAGTAPSTDVPQDLLITGHEDGTVRVWCAGGVCVSLLHCISTAALFTTDDPPADDGAGAEDDDWPPFRKAGVFDPYSDDPRLGIKRVEMCGLSGQLVLAGTAGQVLVLHYAAHDTPKKPTKPQAVEVNLVAENDNFVWKSHSKLTLRDEPVTLGGGLELQLLLQLHPPASCTSLHLHSEWGLLACGTAHGFALADVITGTSLLAKSTLSTMDLANAADEGPMSRRKSLKKSLRESFRRLRRGRSQRKTTQVAQNRPTAKSCDEKVLEASSVGKVGVSKQEEEGGRQDMHDDPGVAATDGGDILDEGHASSASEDKVVAQGAVEEQIKEMVDEMVESAACLSLMIVSSPGEKEAGDRPPLSALESFTAGVEEERAAVCVAVESTGQLHGTDTMREAQEEPQSTTGDSSHGGPASQEAEVEGGAAAAEGRVKVVTEGDLRQVAEAEDVAAAVHSVKELRDEVKVMSTSQSIEGSVAASMLIETSTSKTVYETQTTETTMKRGLGKVGGKIKRTEKEMQKSAKLSNKLECLEKKTEKQMGSKVEAESAAGLRVKKVKIQHKESRIVENMESQVEETAKQLESVEVIVKDAEVAEQIIENLVEECVLEINRLKKEEVENELNKVSENSTKKKYCAEEAIEDNVKEIKPNNENAFVESGKNIEESVGGIGKLEQDIEELSAHVEETNGVLSLKDELLADSSEEKLEKDKHETETEKDPPRRSFLKEVSNFFKEPNSSGGKASGSLKHSKDVNIPNDATSASGNAASFIPDGDVDSARHDPAAPVPFLYYVTPRHFRDHCTDAVSDLERSAREERKLQRLKTRSALLEPSVSMSSDDDAAGAAQRVRDIEEQRKAGFFSLPRMVDPGEAYAAADVADSRSAERSHYSLPRFLSPKAMKQQEEQPPLAGRTGLARFKNFLLRRDRRSSKSSDSGGKAGTAAEEATVADEAVSAAKVESKVVTSDKKKIKEATTATKETIASKASTSAAEETVASKASTTAEEETVASKASTTAEEETVAIKASTSAEEETVAIKASTSAEEETVASKASTTAEEETVASKASTTAEEEMSKGTAAAEEETKEVTATEEKIKKADATVEESKKSPSVEEATVVKVESKEATATGVKGDGCMASTTNKEVSKTEETKEENESAISAKEECGGSKAAIASIEESEESKSSTAESVASKPVSPGMEVTGDAEAEDDDTRVKKDEDDSQQLKTTKSSISGSETPDKKQTLPKKKRQLFGLGRVHHSKDMSSSDGNLAALPKAESAVPEQTKAKCSSLTRPRSLWFGFRESKDKESPVVLETSPLAVMVTKPSDEPLYEGAQVKQRKQRINFTLRGLTKSKAKPEKPAEPVDCDKSQSPIKTPAEAQDHAGTALQRSPSYEIAVSSRHPLQDSDERPKKSVLVSSGSKLKQLFKTQSVVLRNPFSRSQALSNKRKSCPVGALDDGEGPWPLSGSVTHRASAPDITDRHPSISTFIDDTPVAGSPPVIAAAASSAGAAATNTVLPSAILPPSFDLDEPPHYPPPSIPSSPVLDPASQAPADLHIDVESLSSQSSSDKEDDLEHADGSRSVERSVHSGTLERKLTFSLPPGSGHSGGVAADGDVAVRPVERAIESRQQSSDYIGSMVRCLHLSKCFIANSQVMSATLWAGTNSGAIYVFTIAIPPSDKRREVAITVQLGKEIHLKHAAPVLSVTILDGQARPFPAPLAVKKEMAPPPDTTAPHKVLICSEEQFKVFTLPQLKPFCKYKLTAIDGSRVRKIGFGEFSSVSDPSYREPCFTVVTNQGDASVFSLPDCRRQLAAACFKREDINGISSVVFSPRGEALFLTSPSEMMRVSLSASTITQPRPTLSLSTLHTPAAEVVPPQSPPKVDGPTATAAVAAAAAAPPASDADTSKCKEDSAKDGSVKEDSAKAAEGEEKAVEGSHSLEVTETSSPGAGKLEEVNGGDTSVLSGDITIDSIRDHINSSTVVSSNTQAVTRQTITVIKTSTTGDGPVQEETSTVTTTVVENSSGDTADAAPATADTTVNGTEDAARETRRRRGAPLAKVESFFIKNPRGRPE